MKYIAIMLAVCGLAYAGYYFAETEKESDTEFTQTTSPDSVISYISKNISQLSPQKEVLGGTFYVTNIVLDAGTGTVDYEDGHNAFVANFEYSHSDDGQVVIERFEIIE